jgi:hypothetical protein
MKLRGIFTVHLNDIVVAKAHNDITANGLNYLWTRVLNTGATPMAMYLGLMTKRTLPAVTSLDIQNDTMASHAGWDDYQKRLLMTPGPSASDGVKTFGPATYTFTETKTIVGLFTTTNAGPTNFTNGFLYSEALLDSEVKARAGDRLRVTYTMELTEDV